MGGFRGEEESVEEETWVLGMSPNAATYSYFYLWYVTNYVTVFWCVESNSKHVGKGNPVTGRIRRSCLPLLPQFPP